MAFPPVGVGTKDNTKSSAEVLRATRAEQFTAVAVLTEAQTAYDKSKSDVKLGWTGGAMKASVIALSDASQALELAKTRLDAANKALASAEVAARSGQAVAAAARESKG